MMTKPFSLKNDFCCTLEAIDGAGGFIEWSFDEIDVRCCLMGVYEASFVRDVPISPARPRPATAAHRHPFDRAIAVQCIAALVVRVEVLRGEERSADAPFDPTHQPTVGDVVGHDHR